MTSAEKSLVQSELHFEQSILSHIQSMNDSRNQCCPGTDWHWESFPGQMTAIDRNMIYSLRNNIQCIQNSKCKKMRSPELLKMTIIFHQLQIKLTKAEKSFNSNNAKNINT